MLRRAFWECLVKDVTLEVVEDICRRILDGEVVVKNFEDMTAPSASIAPAHSISPPQTSSFVGMKSRAQRTPSPPPPPPAPQPSITSSSSFEHSGESGLPLQWNNSSSRYCFEYFLVSNFSCGSSCYVYDEHSTGLEWSQPVPTFGPVVPPPQLPTVMAYPQAAFVAVVSTSAIIVPAMPAPPHLLPSAVMGAHSPSPPPPLVGGPWMAPPPPGHPPPLMSVVVPPPPSASTAFVTAPNTYALPPPSLHHPPPT
ncbi:hypothetical protein Aperf_G00000110673 [Anoplocephala perfoliata]